MRSQRNQTIDELTLMVGKSCLATLGAAKIYILKFTMLPLISFRILALCKKRTFRFIPAICKDCTDSEHRLRLLSFFFISERKTCCILPLISFCILADSNLQLTDFFSWLSFLYPLHVLLICYAFPYPNKEESIRMTDI